MKTRRIGALALAAISISALIAFAAPADADDADPAFTQSSIPTISGTAQVGKVLTADPGDWEPAGATFGYQWFDQGTAISGATDPIFSPTAAQVGDPLTVQVTAALTGYATTTEESAPTDPVAPGVVQFGDVQIKGAIQVGTTLKGSVLFGGGISEELRPTSGFSFSWQWYANGQPIDGAGGTHELWGGFDFTPTTAQIGERLALRVTMSAPGYAAHTKASAQTVPVAHGTFQPLKLSITGTPHMKEKLRVAISLGSCGAAAATCTYEWYADGARIWQADGASFVARSGEVGKIISVKLTQTEPGFVTAVTTASTATAVAPSMISTHPLTISSYAQLGRKIAAHHGKWTNGVTFTYQWYASHKPIAGATKSTFTPTSALKGKSISYSVTGTRPGYATVAETSASTRPVVRK